MRADTAIVEAIDWPALVVDSDGRISAVNAAFLSTGADAGALARLAPGDTTQTRKGDNGPLHTWRAAALPGARRLISCERSAEPEPIGDQYLAALSHEIRTPLNGVLGMADLLADTQLAADQQAYLSTLRECGRHLLGLVNDALDLARLDAGALTLHPAPVAPASLLQSTAELLSPRAGAKGLEIAWSAPAGLPTVMADEARIRQILFNLAGNAVKFTETGGVHLSVDARLRGPMVRLRFWVRDTGPGVPASERDRIFDPFVQAHGDGRRTDSAGLGLAIVRRLSDAHGGEVGLTCPPEGGSDFFFEADFRIAGRSLRRRGPLTGRQVAIVSPNPVLRTAAAALVSAAGGRPVACADPEAALAQTRPDAVALVDHALAGGKRGRLAQPLEGRACVILLAPEDRGRIAKYREIGFEGYLIKPLRDVSLIERVRVASGAAAARAEAADDRIQERSGEGLKVLLAEDNPVNALLARSLLEREGCATDRVANGSDALSAAANQAYDLILMDIRMPGLDGLAAARALRANGVRTPIIALTANAFEEDRRACLAAGMDDFLSKPLAPDALRAALRRVRASGWTGRATKATLSA